MTVRVAVENKSLLEELKKFTNELDLEFVSINKKADLVIGADKFICSYYEELKEGPCPTLIVTVEEDSKKIPQAFITNYCDHMLVLPVRSFDFLSCIRWHYHLENLREVEASSKGLPELVRRLQDDVRLAQKIQRRLIKDKFPPMQGLSVKSKYWCGEQPGGDYFDVIEFADGCHVGFLMCDSSSYSLSTNFLGALLQLSAHVTKDDLENPALVIAKLYEQIKATLKPKDSFSILYAILNRKTFEFRYVAHGNIWLLHKGASNKWLASEKNAPPLSRTEGVTAKAHEISLDPEDRLIFMSDGWQQCLKKSASDIVEKNSRLDAQDFVNEMSFKLKKDVQVNANSEQEDEMPMPAQDCSILVVDIAKNILRLAKA